MKADKIINDILKKQYAPVYWLEGEEDFYIDEVTELAEHNILSEAEAEFNLTIFYGKDTDVRDIITACRRYPMFAERQVVIVREAQQLKAPEELAAYINSPLSSTVLVVAHKKKVLDKRTGFAKLVHDKTKYFLSSKLKDEQLPGWIQSLASSKGYQLKPKSAALILEHIGNDLSRISNEMDKIAINLGEKKDIEDADIEKYVGISKEYNVYELQAAIVARDRGKAVKIIQYFEANPKAVSIHFILPTLYGLFSKAYAAFALKDKSDHGLKTIFYYSAIPQGKSIMKSYGYDGVERVLLLLHHYNLKSLGVHTSTTNDASLLKEMIIKMMM